MKEIANFLYFATVINKNPINKNDVTKRFDINMINYMFLLHIPVGEPNNNQ